MRPISREKVGDRRDVVVIATDVVVVEELVEYGEYPDELEE